MNARTILKLITYLRAHGMAWSEIRKRIVPSISDIAFEKACRKAYNKLVAMMGAVEEDIFEDSFPDHQEMQMRTLVWLIAMRLGLIGWEWKS